MASEHPTEEKSGSQRTESPAEDYAEATNTGISTASAPPQLQPAVDSHERTTNEGRNRRDNIRLVLEITGLVVLFGYTTFAALQWREMKKTADSAESSSQSAKSAFQSLQKYARAGDRPIIWGEARPGVELRNKQTGAYPWAIHRVCPPSCVRP